MFARLERGVSLGQAQAEMNGICRQLELAYPQTNTGRTVQVNSLLNKTVGPIRDSLHVLMGAVVFVLLIACVNVANLQLARSSVRRKEMAVRAALGASRSRMTRMLLTESAVLAGIGGMCGWGLACLAVDGIKILFADNVVFLSERLPRATEIAIDSHALLFTGAITVLTGLIFGVLPAVQTVRLAQQDGLQDEGRGTVGSRQGRRTRSILVVMEVALALILLAGAGLLLRSFSHLTAVKPGFDSSRVMSMVVSLHGQPEMVGEKREAFYRSALEKIGALPGVISASAVNHLPLGGDLWVNAIGVEGRPTPKPGERTVAVYRVARAGYFRTMGITLAEGRDFDAQDAADTPGVAIINERLARTQWPGEDPIGRRITLDNPEKNPKWLVIVGVIKDVRQKEWIREADNEIYVPFIQSPFSSASAGNYSAMTIVARTAADPVALGGAMQQAIRSVNGAAPISRLATLDQVVDATLWQSRFNLMLTAMFAGVALLLAALGLYGICSYGVVQRTREIGVRLALGAQRRDVLVLVLGQGVKLAGIGLLFGLAGAFGVTRVLGSLLYQVEPTDFATFLLVSLLLLIVSLFACWLPARRAAKVDPMVALRAE